MNNLQPLKWQRIDTAKLSGIYCQKTDSYIEDAVSFCSTLVADYVIRQDKETGKYSANYGGRHENTYSTIDEAEHWAEFTHYASQIQPYVKPMPTWIDVNERLPDDKEKYLVLTECGKVWTGHYGLVSKNPNEWWLHGYTVKQGWHPYEVTHWMSIPEFSTMQNLHKGGDCE